MPEHDTARTSEKDEVRKRGKTRPVANLDRPEGDQLTEPLVDMPELSTSEAILGLQQTYGNRHVQKLVEPQRQDGLDPQVADKVESQKGSGKPIDTDIQSEMEAHFDHDFSQVRIHTDAEANKLSGELGAEAFTAGKDVFFRQGFYHPDSEKGEGLLAHELTHVVQQTDVNAPISRLTSPLETVEREAKFVAQRFHEDFDVLAISHPEITGAVARQATPEAPSTPAEKPPEASAPGTPPKVSEKAKAQAELWSSQVTYLLQDATAAVNKKDYKSAQDKATAATENAIRLKAALSLDQTPAAEQVNLTISGLGDVLTSLMAITSKGETVLIFLNIVNQSSSVAYGGILMSGEE